jgi:hypothetical protein
LKLVDTTEARGQESRPDELVIGRILEPLQALRPARTSASAL